MLSNSTRPAEISISPESSFEMDEMEMERKGEREPTWPRSWRAYTTLFGGFLLMFNSWGLVNAFGAFQSYYLAHLLPKHDDVLIPFIGGTQSFFILASSFICGRLLDAGHHRLLGGIGAILVTGGMFLLSICAGNGGRNEGHYWAIWLTQGLTVGLGMGAMFVYSSQVVATWFIKRRGFAIGITASGASIAGLVYPILFKFMVAKAGFPVAVRYVAVLAGATSFLAFICAMPSPDIPLRKPEKWLSKRVWVDTKAFQDRGYVWVIAGMNFVFLALYPVMFNVEGWAQWKGIGVKEDIAEGTGGLGGREGFRTFYFLSMMNAFSTFGRIGGAYLCDRYGALNVHTVATFLASIFLFAFWPTSNSVGSALAFVILFGIVSGTVIGLPPACVASLLPEEEQKRLGQWTGMMYTIAAPASLIGPVIVGELVSAFEYLPVMGWSGGCFFCAAACMATARYKAGGLKKWKSAC